MNERDLNWTSLYDQYDRKLVELHQTLDKRDEKLLSKLIYFHFDLLT